MTQPPTALGRWCRDLDPDMEVDVEILDVTEEEARTLLLSIDPLAELAQTQTEFHQRLLEQTPVDNAELQGLWQQLPEAVVDPPSSSQADSVLEQFYVLIPCRDEKHQVELLQRFCDEGLAGRALIS